MLVAEPDGGDEGLPSPVSGSHEVDRDTMQQKLGPSKHLHDTTITDGDPRQVEESITALAVHGREGQQLREALTLLGHP